MKREKKEKKNNSKTRGTLEEEGVSGFVRRTKDFWNESPTGKITGAEN